MEQFFKKITMYALHLYVQLLKNLDPNQKKWFQPWDNSQPHLDFAGSIKLNSCEAAQHLPQDYWSHLGSRCAIWLTEHQQIERAAKAVSGALGRILTDIDIVTVRSCGTLCSLFCLCFFTGPAVGEQQHLRHRLCHHLGHNTEKRDVQWSRCEVVQQLSASELCGLGNQELAFLGEPWWLVPASRSSCSESTVFCLIFVIQQNCQEPESLGFIYDLGNRGRKVDVYWGAYLGRCLRGHRCASSPATLPACVSLSPALSLWSFLLPNDGTDLSGFPSPPHQTKGCSCLPSSLPLSWLPWPSESHMGAKSASISVITFDP